MGLQRISSHPWVHKKSPSKIWALLRSWELSRQLAEAVARKANSHVTNQPSPRSWILSKAIIERAQDHIINQPKWLVHSLVRRVGSTVFTVTVRMDPKYLPVFKKFYDKRGSITSEEKEIIESWNHAKIMSLLTAMSSEKDDNSKKSSYYGLFK